MDNIEHLPSGSLEACILSPEDIGVYLALHCGRIPLDHSDPGRMYTSTQNEELMHRRKSVWASDDSLWPRMLSQNKGKFENVSLPMEDALCYRVI